MKQMILDNALNLIGLSYMSFLLYQVYLNYFKTNNTDKHDLIANYVEMETIKRKRNK